MSIGKSIRIVGVAGTFVGLFAWVGPLRNTGTVAKDRVELEIGRIRKCLQFEKQKSFIVNVPGFNNPKELTL
jgi:hypothetical protein